jgi:uncharacterized Zn-binding protein involved in type VI secretion
MPRETTHPNQTITVRGAAPERIDRMFLTQQSRRTACRRPAPSPEAMLETRRNEMGNAARVGDLIGHGGAILTGSDNVEINGQKAAFVSSVAACVLHPSPQAVVTGSSTVTINGHAATFTDCLTSCGAPIVSGSDNVTIG